MIFVLHLFSDLNIILTMFNSKIIFKMKKNYFIALLVLAFQFASAQLEPVAYRGAFAPAPAAMWTDSWTNWNPLTEAYTDATTIVTVSANITANTTWTTGKTYKLNGTIYVTNNATLTIQPGVIVKGIYSNTGTALVITKGAKINAVGTASAPIVFTSDKAAGSRAAGDWGGIILLGKDKFNQTGGLNNIEGLAANTLTEYGGGTTPDVNDNSGILKYVRIEFGGFVFSPNNEINGLTMGAVGAGTTIDYVQVSYSGDDSFEWFGGSVNCKHLVAYRGLDDDLDTDNGYAGTVQYALCIRDPQISDNPAISTSEGFESDNNPTDTDPIAGTTNTSAIFSNCTMIGPNKRNLGTLASGYKRSLRLRRRTELKVINTVFLDWTNNYAGLTDDSTIAKAIKGELKLNNNIFAGLTSSDLTSFPEGINPRTKVINAAINTIAPTATIGTTFDLGAWMTAHNNSVIGSSDTILAMPYDTANYSSYTGLDYRPGSLASTGADFTDTKIAPYVTNLIAGTQPVTTDLSLCVGAIATPLTATLTSTGVSLKWYKSTTLTGTKTAIVGNATPTTTAAGTQYFWVSQLDAIGNESTKAGLVVTVNAKPTATFAGIYNTTASVNTTAITTFAAGLYVGTTTSFKFEVPALTDATLSYLWSVPSGVNIVSGGTATDNTITVNFAGVTPDFIGTVGTIGVQAVNASGCPGTAKSFTITTVLPTAPAAIKVTNAALSGTAATTAITNYGAYAGTTSPLTLTATASATAASYVWSLPAGVNVITSGTPVTTTKVYYVYPFSGTPGVGNTSSGAHKWTVTYNAYTVDVNGVATTVTISTAKQQIINGNTIDPFLPYGTVITSNTNAILVNFAGVTSPSTTVLYIGVKAKNGAGESVTSNATNVDVVANSTSLPGLFNTTYTETYVAPVNGCTAPNCGSSTWAATGFAAKTSKLLKLIATIPAAPTTLVLTNPASLTPVKAVTDISMFDGTTTALTLTAAASPLASSYEWELPTGVNAVSGSDLTSRIIQVNFSGVPAGLTSLYIGVKAKNVIGTSITSNATAIPATSSVAKLLKLTAKVPAAVSVVTGQVSGVCASSTVDYAITAPLGALSYIITVPTGSVITSPSNLSNTTNSLATSDLNFTVHYSSDFATVTPKTIVITSVNNVGNSLTNKSLTIATAMTVTSVSGGTSFTRCDVGTFVANALGATNYTWTVANGATILSGQGTNTVVVDFTAVPDATLSTLLKVQVSNACGVLSTVKSVTLASTLCAGSAKMANTTVSYNITEIYPNPANESFNAYLETQVSSKVNMQIYAINGTLISERTLSLEPGTNNITENVSEYSKGIYFVKFTNSNTNETIIKKLIKE